MLNKNVGTMSSKSVHNKFAFNIFPLNKSLVEKNLWKEYEKYK